MSNSIKKILYIGLPIVLVMIAVSILFYVKSNQFSDIMRSTADSELISFSIVENSFKSEETVDSTEENKQYQTKIIFELHNMAKYDLGYFDVNVEFIENGNDEKWTYTQEDFSFYGDNKLIITSTRPYEATSINNVYVTFEDDESKNVYIYQVEEYKELYGENNEIISPTTKKIYNTLTIACILFTIVIAIAVALLIVVYTRPDENELAKITPKSKNISNDSTTKKTINTSNTNNAKVTKEENKNTNNAKSNVHTKKSQTTNTSKTKSK